MKKQFKHQGNYDYLIDSDMEVPKGESMTVPDEAMPMSEILERFSNGIAPAISLDGQYSDTDDFEDFDPIINDLTDIDDLRREHEELITKLEEDKLKKEEAQRLEDINKEIDRRMKQRKSVGDGGIKSAGANAVSAADEDNAADKSVAQSK